MNFKLHNDSFKLEMTKVYKDIHQGKWNLSGLKLLRQRVSPAGILFF
jgi:hypothetical protein